MKRLFTTLVLLQFCTSAHAGSLLTKSDEFSKVATYGLGLSTNAIEKGNAKAAAEKLLLFDVIWDVMGKGEEFLLNGDPQAFPKFKDDLLKVKLVIDKVGEAAEKLGAGIYDEALIASVDGMVGLVNHPVVNLTWEATKFTYQSHQLLIASKVSLEVETLYGIVNQDRRLIGVSSGKNPPEIPINADSVSYFYNKYMITDASTRGLVLTYVKNVLGEKVPELELSTGTSIWAALTMSGQAVQDEHELRLLQEFENNSRRWIKSLLQDLNKQVRMQWAETRLNQEREKFKVFSAQFGKAFANIDEAFAYYARLNAIKKQQSQFPLKLEEFKKTKNEAEKAYATLKAKDSAAKMGIRGQLFKLAENCNEYAIFSLMISDQALENQFRQLQEDCLRLVKKFDEELQTSTDSLIQESMLPPTDWSDTIRRYQLELNKLFMPVVEEAKTTYGTYVEPPTAEIKTLLSENKLQEAQLKLYEWQYPEKLPSNSFNPYKKIQEVFINARPDVQQAPHLQWLRSEGKRIGEVELRTAAEQVKNYLKNAKKLAEDTCQALEDISKARQQNDLNTLWEQINYFAGEQERVHQVVKNHLKQLVDFSEQLQMSKLPSLGQAEDEMDRYLRENGYATMGKLNDNGVILPTVASFIRGKQGEIISPINIYAGMIGSADNIDSAIYAFTVLTKQWQKWLRLDEKTIALYNDLAKYSSEEALSNADYESRSKAYKDRAPLSITRPELVFMREGDQYIYKEMPKTIYVRYRNADWARIDYKEMIAPIDTLIKATNPSTIKSKGSARANQARTEIINRQTDSDYLDRLSRQWDSWYGELTASKLIHLDRQSGRYFIAAEGAIRKDEATGYAIINEPYPHFASLAELGKNESVSNARKKLERLDVYTFIQNNMPNAKALLDENFSGGSFTPAKEDNFIIGSFPIWKSNLDKADKIVATLTPESKQYRENLSELAELLPLTVSFPELTEKNANSYEAKTKYEIGHFRDDLTTSQYQGFELGQRYITLRGKIQELIAAKGRLLEQERYAKTAENEARKTDSEALGENDAMGVKPAQIITEFYRAFGDAYRDRNDSQLMSFLGDNWESGDGTTLADLQGYLRNSFSVFDEIRYQQSNLQFMPSPAGVHRVTYDLTIAAKIYSDNITHEEKSAVSEELSIDDKGKTRIVRTIGGRFWSVR